MDGQFEFLSLNKRMDWERGTAWNVHMSDAGLSLHQVEKHVFNRTIRLGETSLRSFIVHFTLGSQGILFLLDEQANLWKYDIENDYTEKLFPAGHELFTEMAIMSSNGNTLYVADGNSLNTLAAYSASNGQILWSIQEWEGRHMTPQALQVAPDQTIYVLLQEDNQLDAQEFYLCRVDPSGNVLSMFKHETLNDSTPQSMYKPIAKRLPRFHVQITQSGQIFVLNTHSRQIHRFDQDGRLSLRFSIHQPQSCSSMTMDSDDQLYLGDQRELTLDSEDDRFLVRFNQQGNFDTRLAAFRGRSDDIQIDAKNRIYVWNELEQTISILVLKPRTMELGKTGMLRGVYISEGLDSGSTEVNWHKLLVNAHIPEETQLRMTYFASDRKNFLIHGDYVDLDSFIKDESKTLESKLESLDSYWSEPIVNPKDALLFKAQGRYLWLKIEFIGSEHYTSQLHNMRIYYPRMSLLSYLPAVYQEDEKSRSFLERYLSLFGTFIFEMEEKIEQTPSYFEVELASGEFLKWLATWLGLHINDSWDEPRIRELISHAPDLYKARGTRWAIERMIEIYTGEKPIVVEHFQYSHMLEMSELKTLIAGLYGDNPYHFNVLVKAEHVQNEKQRLVLEHILNEQKPAFTEAQLVVLEPWIYMDMHAYLGVNTYLSELSLMRLDHQSAMPNDTVLIDVDQENRMGVHTRIELDSGLE